MDKYDGDFSKIELSKLMEWEEEVICDIDLYKENIKSLQSDFQQKKMNMKEYMSGYSFINEQITKLIDKRIKITSTINSRIQGMSDNYNEDIKEYVDFYYREDWEENW